jgi:hypothetical protein
MSKASTQGSALEDGHLRKHSHFDAAKEKITIRLSPPLAVVRMIGNRLTHIHKTQLLLIIGPMLFDHSSSLS